MIGSLATMATVELLLANLVVCFAAFVQASAGIGFAMIAVPLLVLIDLTYAPGPSLFVMMFLSIAMAVEARRHIDRQGLATLLPGLCVGTVAGALLLGALPPTWFGLVFGGIVLLALIVGQLGLALAASPALYGAGGFAAGLMGTISGIHGPPLVVLYQRAAHATARATIALIFVIASILSLVSLYLEGIFREPQLLIGLSMLPGLILGYGLAHIGRQLISESLARAVMLIVAGASAIVLIAKSVW
ncbi:sulfite exporter TauE/SafE family protein [Pelagibius litoralis]|uniref:Probable membrane transporter protein n=1 Tax=Pelagibius litoralis TaxID=374515 RepID=A0A967EWR9_9PROT|nr:sulfite exporter TauE/SafE family protein [Pelagibius litoralis]NIA68043.1 sulfite exporter TauE/SafE family protein [Pelagibius litoralis]